MRIKDSFWGLLGLATSSGSSLQVDHIRIAMLKALDVHCADAHLQIDGAIRFATDLEALWYLRTDLMQAVAFCQGELAATQVIQDVTSLFKGHLKIANASRYCLN
jgi:hypothetical protein